MSTAGVFLQEMLLLYSIAILGFIVRKTGMLNKHMNEVLTQLVLYVTLPALILFSLNMPFSTELLIDFFWLVTMSIYVMTISVFLAAWMRKGARLLDKQKSVYEGLIIFGNQGFIGYAIAFILFKEQGIIYLTMFNIYYLLLIWTYGIYLFTKNKQTIDWKGIFFNPGIISTVTGILILLSPFHWPTIIATGLNSIGQMTIPLSMLVIGGFVADIQFKDMRKLMKNIYLWKVAFSRLLFIPLLLTPFIFLSIPFPLLIIAILTSGMPAAATVSLYAQKHGADTVFASVGVLLTNVLCLLTIPSLYMIVSYVYNLIR